MKFKDPETGTIFSDLIGVYQLFCHRHSCKNCKFSNARDTKDGCWGFVYKHPKEAARLMGYEVIEDEQDKPTRASILDEAKRCVCDWKEKDYGIYDNSFETVAELWRTYIEQGCVDDGVDVFLGPKDVAMLMALLQIAHVSCGTATDENFVNLAAYTAYCGEIVGGKK